MKRTTICAFCCLITFIILCSQQSYAQSAAPSSSPQVNQGQMLKDLLDEVRQLRIDLSRMSGSAYRAQMVFERLRLQQEQVNRLTTELNKANTEISDLKSARPTLKEKIEALEKKWETGLIPETELKAAKAEMEWLDRRERSLVDREPQLISELNVERGNLEALKARLDEIEREVLTTSKSEEGKPGKRDR